MIKESEIEKEIYYRMIFKFKELKDAVKNRLSYKFQKAFDMTRESNLHYEAWREFSDVLDKEAQLPTPYTNMYIERKRKLKDEAVKDLTKLIFENSRKGIDINPSRLVSIIEKAQNY